MTRASRAGGRTFDRQMRFEFRSAVFESSRGQIEASNFIPARASRRTPVHEIHEKDILHAQARLQAHVRGARSGRSGAQRTACRAGRFRFRGHFRSLLPLARGARPRTAGLVRVGRGGQCDTADRTDDGGDLSEHALPSRNHCSRRGHRGHAQQQSLHSGTGRWGAPERARHRRRLARKG